MGVLETVFRTRKFDLDDDVLMEFDDYFDKKSRNYNSFSLDEEDFISLQNFVEEIMKKCAVAESSYVSVVGDNAESGKKNVWLIKQENAQVTKLTDQEKISQMIMLYWD